MDFLHSSPRPGHKNSNGELNFLTKCFKKDRNTPPSSTFPWALGPKILPGYK